MTTRYAIIVGCGKFDDSRIIDLPFAEEDATKIDHLFRNEDTSLFDSRNIHTLKSPPLQGFKDILSQVAKEASDHVGSTIYIYIASHGYKCDPNGVHIALKDSLLDEKTNSMANIDYIANLFSEFKVRSSITIMDLCHAGDNLPSISNLALKEKWINTVDDNTQSCEGHLIVSACGQDQSSIEKSGGGIFTQALIECTDLLGKERAYDRYISIEPVIMAIVNDFKDKDIKQKPIWSGINITNQIYISKNPHWIAGRRKPAEMVSFSQVPEDDRSKLLSISNKLFSIISAIGEAGQWQDEFEITLDRLNQIDISAAGKSYFLGNLIRSFFDRIESYGNNDDLNQMLDSVGVLASCFAENAAPDTAEWSYLCYRFTLLYRKYKSNYSDFFSNNSFINKDDGPGQISIGPIRFWDKIGEMALLALAHRSIGDASNENIILNEISSVIISNPEYQRLTWEGQLPDISAGIGCLYCIDPKCAIEVANNILNKLIFDINDNNWPVPVLENAYETGRELANQIYKPHNLPYDEASECLGVLTLFLCYFTPAPLEQNTIIGRLIREENIKDYFLYIPDDFNSQFQEIMENCTIKTWIRRSEESSTRFLEEIPDLIHGPLAGSKHEVTIQTIKSLSVARRYRNRSAFFTMYGIAETK